MKAVVVEVSGKTAVALKKDGTFVKTARACSIGDIIEITEPQRFFMVSRKFTAIAAALLACIIAGGVFSYQTVFAASYISLDVNPSLEYALNRQNRVIEVKALNSDAEPIAEQLLQEGIRNDTIAEAVSETMEILYKENYLGTGEESVLIAVSSDSAKTADQLKQIVSDTVDAAGEGRDGGIKLQILTTPVSVRNSAREAGMSAGEYQMAQQKSETAGDGSSGVEKEGTGNSAETGMTASMPAAEKENSTVSGTGMSDGSGKAVDIGNNEENTGNGAAQESIEKNSSGENRPAGNTDAGSAGSFDTGRTGNGVAGNAGGTDNISNDTGAAGSSVPGSSTDPNSPGKSPDTGNGPDHQDTAPATMDRMTENGQEKLSDQGGTAPIMP